MGTRKVEKIKGENLRALLKRAGVSNLKMSEELGHSFSYVSNCLNTCHMPLAELKMLCSMIGADYNAIIDKDEPEPVAEQDLTGLQDALVPLQDALADIRTGLDEQTMLITDMGKIFGTMLTIMRSGAEEAQKSYVSVNSMMNKIYNHLKYERKE